jgi:hypothetical protein
MSYGEGLCLEMFTTCIIFVYLLNEILGTYSQNGNRCLVL